MRFLLIDDHKIIREGLKQILLLHFPGSKVEESSTPEEVVQKISKVKFDLVISDLSIPGTSGLEVVKQVKEVNDTLPVLILSMHPEQHYALRVLKAGAWGYVNKADGAEVLIPAITKILQGKKYIPAEIAEQLADNLSVKHSESELPHTILSEREFAVFKLIAEGNSISDISQQLSVGVSTVSTHRARILQKMKMKSNVDLVKYALQHNLI